MTVLYYRNLPIMSSTWPLTQQIRKRVLIFWFKSQLALMTTCQLEWRRYLPGPSSHLVLIIWDLRSTHALLVCNLNLFKSALVQLPKIIYDLWGSLESSVTSGDAQHHPGASCSCVSKAHPIWEQCFLSQSWKDSAHLCYPYKGSSLKDTGKTMGEANGKWED